MRFLINCSNLKRGGGLQVADSVCKYLPQISQHQFVVVLSSQLEKTKQEMPASSNVKIVTYDVPNNWQILLRGRDQYLDGLVKAEKVDAVLTIFGPSRWQPRCPHLCGFARAQLLLKDSPYYQQISWKEKIKFKIWAYYFKKSSRAFYTENAYISSMLPQLLGKDTKVFTVTNYYNQVFDNPAKWGKTYKLPHFDGTTILSVSTSAPHKNFAILKDVIAYLDKKYPEFNYRFVLTQKEEQLPFNIDGIKQHFVFLGQVDISECPYLYEQADVMLMPTLMECFTATYPEAMRMDVPIVTTDLPFAHSLCGEAACFYEATNAQAAAEAIYKVSHDQNYSQQLVNQGKQHLLTYDNYKQRAEKLVQILEKLADSRAKS